jgi:NADH-quinone oxidoreductase subunit I
MQAGTGRNNMGLFKDIKNLLLGMKITSRHLGRHAITIQYPEEKMEMPERSRGVVVLLSDKKTGELNCTACMLCMRYCPTAAIRIDAPRDENKRRVLKAFTVDFGLCCYCGLCEEACNFAAIKLATKYEYSTWDKDEVLWDMNRLQEEGRDVPYEMPERKRPVRKAVAGAKKSDDKSPDDSGDEKSGKSAEKDDTVPSQKQPGQGTEKTGDSQEKLTGSGMDNASQGQGTSDDSEGKG